MPTKKTPSAREREIADKKNHPIAKATPVAVAQNGEVQPRRKKG